MRVVIVGGTSALGRTLKPVLSSFGDVLTAGRTECDLRVDLDGPPDEMTLPEGLDAVIHTAARFRGATDAEILATESANVLGTLKLCQAAVRARARQMVLISSLSACVEAGSPYYGIYAISKRHAEEAARFYCGSRGLPLAILRPSQLYGDEAGFRRHQPFIYAIVDKAERGDDVEIYGSHDARRNYIHADDLAAMIAKVIQTRVEGTYACAYPSDITYSEVARAAFAAFGAGGTVRFLQDKPDIPDNVFTPDDALYARIQLYPRINMAEGMRQMARHRRLTAS
jgi:nucleoside-diphosphate-sugar epimerase